jgi:hypothetical protein
MKTTSILYHLTRADVLERLRRFSFLITLGLTLFAVYAYLPPANAGYLTLGLGNYRGIYNSAWVGSATALLTSAFLSLPGFYLVKNAVERDITTGVGQIIATTPLRKVLYPLGKALSNFAVLAILVGIIAGASLGMQFIRGEDRSFDLWVWLAPFVFITLPTMALIASLAVFFEVVRWLRGTLGTIVYFACWIVTLVGTIAVSSQLQQGNLHVSAATDVFGVTSVITSMQRAAFAAFPEYHGSFAIGVTAVQGHVQTFDWQGVHWTSWLILERLLWIGVALGIALGAALFFHRFDPAHERTNRVAAQKESPLAVQEAVVPLALPPVRLPPLPPGKRRFHFGEALHAELRIMFKGTPWWWYLIALGLIVTGWFIPAGGERLLLALAWIWPIRHWSALGNREVSFQTHQLIFTTPHPLRRQLPTLWLTGVLLAVVTGSGIAGHLLLEGNWSGLCAWMVGALFIPTLALCLGIWGGSTTLFEAVYLAIWYLGPVNQVLWLDYTGMTRDALTLHLPGVYFLSTLILLICAVIGRKRQLAL